MMRVLVALVFLLGCGSLLLAAAQPADEIKPIPAAEGERRAAETRDFLVDLLADDIDTHWHAGKWDDCIRLLRQSIELDPYFAEAYSDAAWLLANMNRDGEAIAMYQAGIAKNPKDPELYQQFGLFYHRRHKYEEAVEQFRKAVQAGAPQVWQHMLPGTLEKAGRKQEALDEWRALLKRFPGDKVAKQHIETLEKELERKA